MRLTQQLLRLSAVRKLVGKVRLRWFVHVRRFWKVADSEAAFEKTVSHNLKQLKSFSNKRMELLAAPLAVIETLDEGSSVLVVGPRNENDLFILASHGFTFGKLQALDLISYSPKITPGDIHAAPFDDSSFDAVVCGWTLSYSSEPAKVAGELVRLVKPGGIVAIAVEYSDLTHAEQKQLSGYEIASAGFERVNSVAQFRALFGDSVEHVYFDHDAPKRLSHRPDKLVARPSSVAMIFSVAKPPSNGSATP
ncbi:MAG: methyltransferase domain-containing protein [Planctomycetota bacterium]